MLVNAEKEKSIKHTRNLIIPTIFFLSHNILTVISKNVILGKIVFPFLLQNSNRFNTSGFFQSRPKMWKLITCLATNAIINLVFQSWLIGGGGAGTDKCVMFYLDSVTVISNTFATVIQLPNK